MKRLNYQHLFYFWTVAKRGGITAACDELHLAQPTISTQLALFEQSIGNQLFDKQGRKLLLTDTGRLVFNYAEEIFTLGGELTNQLKGINNKGARLNVGITDALPKLLAYRLLEPLFIQAEKVNIHCIEEKTERLLSEIALHGLDIVLSDIPATPSSGTRLFNHLLGESEVAVFAAPFIAKDYYQNFPRCLNGAPFVLPTVNTALRRMLNQWFDEQDINPEVLAEIEDSTLLKTFGSSGVGLFFSPTVVALEIQKQYGVHMLGIANGIHERFYAVTAQRKLKHPLVVDILRQARQGLFGVMPKNDNNPVY